MEKVITSDLYMTMDIKNFNWSHGLSSIYSCVCFKMFAIIYSICLFFMFVVVRLWYTKVFVCLCVVF